jgi:hypothetical protein
MKEFDNDIQEPVKRPNFLVFLLVLSGISVGMSLIGSIQSLMVGPDNQEAFELKMAQMSESMSELKKANLDANTLDWINEFSRQAMSMAEITNFEVFYWNVFFQLIISLVGGFGIFLMFRLKKLGFHLYVVYSLLPILAMYVLFPFEIIPNVIVIGSLLFSGLFCLLYGLNLKHMK